MSNYFGALMRASGLAPADPRPEAARHVVDSHELDRAVEAGPIAREAFPEPSVSHPTDPSFAPPHAQAKVSRATEFAAAPGQIPPTDSAPAGPFQVRDSRDAGDRPGDEHPSEEPPSPSEHATREAGLLAALRWVRADPQLARPQETRDLRVPAIEVEGAAAEPETPPPMTPTRAHAKPSAVVDAAQAFTVQAALLPARDDVPSNTHEVVEVSIGAIHVRVDAPAPRPKAQSDTVRTPPRSGLARRALRRI